MRGNRFGIIDKTECIGGFIAGSDFGKSGFLKEFADGKLLDGGKNRTFRAKRCLTELFLIHLCQRERICVDAGAEVVAREQSGQHGINRILSAIHRVEQ